MHSVHLKLYKDTFPATGYTGRHVASGKFETALEDYVGHSSLEGLHTRSLTRATGESRATQG